MQAWLLYIILAGWQVAQVSLQECGAFGSGNACRNGGACDTVTKTCACGDGIAGNLCAETDFEITSKCELTETEGSEVCLLLTKRFPNFDLTVTITVNGTADDDDLLIVPNSFTVANGVLTENITVSIRDDEIMELEENVNLIFTTPADNIKIFSFNISRSDPIIISLTQPSVMDEGAGNQSVTVQCMLPSETMKEDTPFQIGPSGSYTGDINAKDVSVACEVTQLYEFQILDDSISEEEEAFVFSITPGPSVYMIGNSSFNVVIQDDDAVIITSHIPRAISEDGGQLTFAAEEFKDAAGNDVAVNINITLEGGSAVEGTDYTVTSSTPFSVNIVPGDISSRSTLDDFQVNPQNDDTFEPDKQLTVRYTSNFLLAGDTSIDVTLLDDELEPLTMTGPDEVNETATEAVFAVERALPFRDTTLTYCISSDQATTQFGVNVADACSTVTLNIGNLSQEFTVAILDDSNYEPSEYFTINVTGSRIAEIPVKTVQILENEVDTLTISGADTVQEGDTPVYTLTRGSTFEEVTVLYDVRIHPLAQYPITSEDVDLISSAQVTFPEREDSVNITVTISDDESFEPDEVFSIFVHGNSGLQEAEMLVTIANDDPVIITSHIPRAISEDGGPITFAAEEFKDAAGNDVAVNINITVEGGSAVESTDYIVTSSTPFSVNIVPGDISSRADLDNLQVKIVKNSVFEPDKQLIVRYTSDAPLAGDTSIDVTLLDDELEPITMTGPDQVNETATEAVFTVERASTFRNTTLTYCINSDQAAAQFGANVADACSTLTLNIQELSQEFTVTILDDSNFEPSESFTINVTGSRIVEIPVKTVLILENEVDTLTISGADTVQEGDTPVYTLIRGSTFEEVTVLYDVRIHPLAQYPITSEDVDLKSSAQVTFPEREDSVNITVTILDDESLEPDEVFSIFVHGNSSIQEAEKLVTIANDDPDSIEVTSFLMCDEDHGSARVELTRTLAAHDIVVQVTTMDSEAVGGSDFTSLSNHDVAFLSGSLTASFSIDLLDDNIVEEDEYLLFNITGADVLPVGPVQFLITDNDGGRPFDCRRHGQMCFSENDTCNSCAPYCQCQDQREGKTCNMDPDQQGKPECSSIDCTGHGVCEVEEGQPKCKCYVGYYGDDCEHYFLKVVCTKTGMMAIFNPHDDFGGTIYVKSKANETECVARQLQDPGQRPSEIEDSLKGFILEVNYTSEQCGTVLPRENNGITSFVRIFWIQYDPDVISGLDQCIQASCSFNSETHEIKDSIKIDSNISSIAIETTNNTFSPVTMTTEVAGRQVDGAPTIPLGEQICITLKVDGDLGGISVAEIRFTNSLEGGSSVVVFSNGCPVDLYKYILHPTPFYKSAPNKQAVTYCFQSFKFSDSETLIVVTAVRICVNASNCNQALCNLRRKREAAEESTLYKKFTVIVPESPTINNQTDTRDEPQGVFQPNIFLSITLGLAAILLVLVGAAISVACLLGKQGNRKYSVNSSKKYSPSTRNY